LRARALQGVEGRDGKNNRCASDSAGVKGAKIMQEQLQARLKVLKAELVAGQVKLRELELQQLRLRELLLRLRGGIQVLEELLGQAKPKPEPSAPQRDSPSAERDPNQQMDPDQEGQPGTEGGGPP